MKRNFIIEKLYNPERPLSEKIPTGEEYKEQSKKLDKLDDEFEEKLKQYPELEKLYSLLNSEMGYMYALYADDCYMEGFRMGMLLAIDIFNIDTFL